MTEPPEPRRPEEDGGEEDDELREFLESEQFGELKDDITLDRLGQYDEPGLDEYLDLSTEDAELTDQALNWKDEIDSEPHSEKLSPEAIMAEFDRRKKEAERTAPPQPKGEPPVSAQDEAARLRQLAGSTEMIANVQASIQSLEAMQGEIQGALGESHSKLNAALGPVQQAIAEANSLVGTIQAALSNLDTVAGQIG